MKSSRESLVLFIFIASCSRVAVVAGEFFNHSVVDKCDGEESCVRFCRSREDYNESDFNLFNLRDFQEAKSLKFDYKVMMGKPDCEFVIEDYPFEFVYNGSIIQHADNNGELSIALTTTSSYCIDKNETSLTVFNCFEEYPDNVVEAVKQLYPILMLFSVPFLVVTFIIYASFRELRNLHGKCLMCYLFGLTSLFLSFALIQLNHSKLTQNKLLCSATGYLAYISLLTCFFWLNVMCYDIFSTFRAFQKNRSCNESHDRRFLCYCLYAFGTPLLITGLVYLVDNASFISNDFPKVRMGQSRCWIDGTKTAELLYVYLPISCGISFNTFSYAFTAYKIFRVRKETSIIRDAGSRRHSTSLKHERHRFFLYLRLFTIMGITWTIEIISWAFKNSLIFHITDILNSLQGIFIFFFFVWKPKVKKLFAKKFNMPRSPSGFRNSSATYMTQFSRTSAQSKSTSSRPSSHRTSGI